MSATVLESAEMGKQRKNDAAERGEEKFATFRCYDEEAEKLNELSRICPRRADGRRTTIADVIRLLSPAMDELLVKYTEQRLTELTKRKK